MEYRLNSNQLLGVLQEWNRFLGRKVHLIACGGTAMTLLGVKPSTKDVDFIAPVIPEYTHLVKRLASIGYEETTGHGWQRPGDPFRFDIFRGLSIHTTGLLSSPLEEGNNTPFKKFSRLYIGILNDYDLIASKLMRGTRVDFDDCVMLAEAHRESLDMKRLRDHFNEMAAYDVSEERVKGNIKVFTDLLHQKGFTYE
jgi:hypothetical protein